MFPSRVSALRRARVLWWPWRWAWDSLATCTHWPALGPAQLLSVCLPGDERLGLQEALPGYRQGPEREHMRAGLLTVPGASGRLPGGGGARAEGRGPGEGCFRESISGQWSAVSAGLPLSPSDGSACRQQYLCPLTCGPPSLCPCGHRSSPPSPEHIRHPMQGSRPPVRPPLYWPLSQTPCFRLRPRSQVLGGSECGERCSPHAAAPQLCV